MLHTMAVVISLQEHVSLRGVLAGERMPQSLHDSKREYEPYDVKLKLLNRQMQLLIFKIPPPREKADK